MSDIPAVICEIWTSHVNLEAGELESKTFEKNDWEKTYLFHMLYYIISKYFC